MAQTIELDRIELEARLAAVQGPVIRFTIDEWTIEVSEGDNILLTTLPVPTLLQSIRQVACAVNVKNPDHRISSRGIYFGFEPDMITVMGHDEYRLSISRLPHSPLSRENFTVNAKDLVEASRDLSKLGRTARQASAEMRLYPNYLNIRVPATKTDIAIERLTEPAFGLYPSTNTESLVPPPQEQQMCFSRQGLLTALKLFDMSPEAEPVQIEATQEPDRELHLLQEVTGREIPKTENWLSATGSLSRRFALNPRFLRQFLRASLDPTIRMEAHSTDFPIVFSTPGSRNYIHAIMPI